jgi:hypothetical protein
MAHKPPHSTLDRLFASPTNEKRMNNENRAAKKSYDNGKNFRKGQRDG